ncbi:M20/M25/M40 family metallo-hydrolase [Prauserella muralis]|uniref:Peptidase M20 n=1 Tax=Prauserella muralis TaxID=588067 RepID=A0A2V4B8J4_9PSEU|nr:M20/M25/M40 family metallo-hydrolase [Prauserella muralis]PXY31570.1 peptidase M20 [Prauserella muralis]TWE14073.1 acetylornithine deacetylase/succinyl-diaminopimelate desuccinylase-like protein [Prauserella muralis]
MDSRVLRERVRQVWAGDALGGLSEFVTIPALSPAFDQAWAANRQLHAAVELVRAWLAERPIAGARAEVVELPGRTPVLLLDVPARDATNPETAVVYGHLDKQPPAGEWSPGLGPWTPVVKDERLYGRGAGDDGYAAYAAAVALEALHAAGGRHARTVVLLETGEESGSPDLPAYLDELAGRLGPVGLVICLDIAGADHERLWLASSVRGIAFLDVTVRVLTSGVHSGHGSGIVPSSFRVLRQLLDRIEDARSGRILLPELETALPDGAADEIRTGVAEGFLTPRLPVADGVRLVSDDPVELVLNNTWRPTLSVTGADGLPPLLDAGNVLRPYTGLKLSFRLPPTVDAPAALAAVEKALTADVPSGAQVELARAEAADGWSTTPRAAWLTSALDEASAEVFGAPWRSIPLGGTIPFLGLFGRAYPDAQFVVTGPRGPGNNAHVPDEWLHLQQTERVTETVARILHAHATAR